ncbi:maleylacetoacetate isomerase (plasmid) [Mesorhizobium sp. ORM8.1]
MSKATLYDYWRSSASYRLRIALNHFGVDYDRIPINLLKDEQKYPDHVGRNPQGMVPVLETDGLRLTQSLAIIEYLSETRAPSLLPPTPEGRARVRALSYVIAMDIHPICNGSVANHVVALSGGGDDVRSAWMQRFIGQGLDAFEHLLDHPATRRFCHGDEPTMADACLVPQVYNAERWGVDMTPMPRIRRIVSACNGLRPFREAIPVPPQSS